MIKKNLTVLTVIMITLLISFGIMSGNDKSTKKLAEEIDAFFSEKIASVGPGASVLVVKEGKAILRRSYGMANLELGVPMNPEMVFRIGSITKQFTAAAILMLVEEGRISLNDEITRFVPDYPTGENKITIRQLLNHTSGIKSYDEIQKVYTNIKKDFKPIEFINIFKDEPLDFKPGEQFRYNNSGYFLLGMVIEKITGKPYEEFIKKRIFEPLGMKNSYYDSHSQIIPNRASGYQPTKKGYVNSDYFSITWGYAGGALLSTVDDLWTWTRALFSGRVVSKKYVELMTTPTKLAGGKSENYGYGFWLKPLFGEKRVDHNGGIFGFLTYVLYLPQKDIFVAVLTNALIVVDAPFMGQWTAAFLCGKDVKRKKAITLDAKILDEIEGVYEISKGIYRTITRDGTKLFSQKTNGRKLEVFASSESDFFFKDSFSFFSIVRDKNGKVFKMVMHGQGPDEEAIKTNQKPKKRKTIKFDTITFKNYTGTYTSEDNIEITISLKNSKFYAQLKGQPEFEIFPESQKIFFFKVADAQLEFFKDAHGNISGLAIHQGGRSLKMRRK